MYYTPTKVTIEGKDYWWLKYPDNTGPIAELYHCDPHGMLYPDSAAYDVSFAHVFANGEVRRYGRVLCDLKDLIPDAA